MDLRTAIESLLYPRSIAIIGASDVPGKFSGRVMKHRLKFDLKGAIFPVNPNRRGSSGGACYASIRDIQAPIDVAIVVVPSSHLFEVLEDCELKSADYERERIRACSSGRQISCAK